MATNNDFYRKRTTNNEFKQIRKNAQHQYRFFEKNITPKDHPDYQLWLGQITLYGGIANWDKALWEKGINKFFKATEKSKERYANEIGSKAKVWRGVNENRDKTKAKDEQNEAVVIMEAEKEDAMKMFDAFVEKKRIYYKEQMPIMYEDYWEGMKKIQEKVKKGKKNRSKKQNASSVAKYKQQITIQQATHFFI